MIFKAIYFKLPYKTVLFSLLFGLMIFTSCKKEDVIEITETEEALEVGLTMTIDDREIQTDVFASYCQMEGEEFLIIANKVENLKLPLSTENFTENDFVFIKSGTEDNSSGFGGFALGESVTGFEGLSILFSNATLIIEDNSEEFVIGSVEGTLSGSSLMGEPIEHAYRIDFVAEVVEVDCETTPAIETSLKMTVNDVEIETNAVAAYCQTENQEILLITSSENFFGWTETIETAPFDENDFMFFVMTIDGITFSSGGMAFGQSVTGFPGVYTATSQSDIIIESNDGQYVTGSSQGIFMEISPSDTINYPYEIEFVAEIIQETDSCQ